MEKNERLKAADKCASRYADENEARIARKAFMLGCEFEAQGEAIKGVILDTLPEQLEVDLENYISNKLRELGADLINHKPYSFNRGLNVGMTKAYGDILEKIKCARKEE